MDDNNGELEELKIDRQRREMLTRADGGVYHYERTGSDSREKKIVDHLLLLAVAALVGAVWVLGRSVAVLQASDTYQNERLAELRGDIKVIEGKTFRGVDGYEDRERDNEHGRLNRPTKKDGANGEASANQRKP